MGIDDARYARQAPSQLVGDLEVVGAVVAHRAHVDLGRQAEIQDLGHHVGRLEIEDGLREGARQFAPELADVVFGRCVALLQGHKDDAVVDADRRAVGEGEIVGPRRQADVVDDQLSVVLGDELADLVLDLLEQPLGGLDARPGRRAHMELDAAAVDHRKEVAADQGEQHGAACHHQDGDGRDDEPVIEQDLQQLDVLPPHGLEAALESVVRGAEQAAEPARRRRMALALGQQADGDRRQGPRQGVGGEHREHDGEPERREEVLGRAVEEDDRREHRADGERRDEGGNGDAGRAVQGRLRQRLTLLGEQAVRVLDRDRGIVDQDADGERQAAQRQGVDGLAQEVERHQRRQDRQRNRDHHHQGRSP